MRILRAPVVIPAVAGVVLVALGRVPQGAVVLGLAAVQVVGPVVAPQTSARVGRTVGRFGHALARALSFVVWLPVALGFVVAWALAPLLRIDPLERRRHQGWATRPTPTGGGRRAAASWAAPDRPALSSGERWARLARRGLATVVLAALVVAVVDARPWGDGSQDAAPTTAPGAAGLVPAPIEPPFALREQEAGDQVRQEEGELFSQIEADPVVGWRLPKDFRGQELNVVGHRRASVEASDSGPVVWFFGGSTMFGSNQRDDRTIASQFARLAADDDRPVRVVNFGVHAYTAYQEAQLLEATVAKEGPPDLVIFYDGYNDVAVAVGLSFLGREPGVPQRAPSLAQDAADALSPSEPAGVPPWMTPEERYASVGAIQEKAATLAERAVGSRGVPVLHFWQPSAFTREPTEDERTQLRSLGIDGTALRTYQEVHDGVRAKLPKGFIDLGDVLDDAPTVYADQVHTNELGALLVAEAMYRAARPTLDEISR